MKQMVSFEKVKLTNNELDQHGHVSICYFICLLSEEKQKTNKQTKNTSPYQGCTEVLLLQNKIAKVMLS